MLLAPPLALLACSKTPEPAPSDPERPPAAAPAPSGAQAAAPQRPQGPTEVAWDVPAGWETAPNPSSMRRATYKIKRADGDPEDAEMSVSQAGGSVEMNIKRWAGQFEQKPGDESKRTERAVGDLKVTVVEIQGTFGGSGMPGMPAGSPKPDWALLGAIVELPGGGPTWFFKLTGPKKTVSAAKVDFDKLVGSLRPK
ncbi:MAG: hypothetical protein IT372_42390 [Polyangiaceae bacterium]|nr:hypothetical protein [Polyangiaceae bacterium]